MNISENIMLIKPSW